MNFIFIPLLVGAFGWCLIWAMVQFIFFPLRPVEIGPFKWENLAGKWMGQIDLSQILPQMTENDSFEALKPVINEKLDDFFRHKLSAKLPMISMFIGDKTIEELKGVFMEELALLFPMLITQFSANLNKDLQAQWAQKWSSIVFQKMNKASMPLRWIAFALGLVWGILIALILPLI